MKYIIYLFLLILTANISFSQESDNKPGEKGRLKVTANSELKVFSPELLNSLHRVSDPQVSPDGELVLFRKSIPNIEDNKVYSDLYFIAMGADKDEQITFTTGSEWNARWSPDGKQIGYISTEKGSPEVYLMDISTKNNRQITATEGGVSNFLFSPDGKSLAFTSDVKIDQITADKYPNFKKANVRIYDDLPVRHWDQWVDASYSHLFIMSLPDGKPYDIMEGERYDTPLQPFGGVEEIAWSPDGKEIAYTAKKVDNFELTTNSDLYIYNLETKQTKNITQGLMGFDKAPLYSPDGKWIAFHSQEREGFESDRIRLMLYNRQSGQITELTKTLDQWVGETIWSPDSKFIYFSAGDRGTVQLYKVDLTGKWKMITSSNYNYDAGLDITPDGQVLIVGRRNMLRPTELYTLLSDGTGEAHQLTHVNDEFYEELAPVNIEERMITSTDGAKVHTWVLYPPNFDKNKKYPMITYCQGGPQSTISQYFSFRWNLYVMASQGYVVVAPNRRGVPGFGQDWNDAISKDWGGMPMQDILAATDAVAKEPFIKKDGLAAVGASAGGYATFWLAGNHEGRFSAFVSHAGVFNLVSMYGATEELWFPNWEYGGPYWEKENYYAKHSPHQYVDKWDTPIMISAGERDYRVPYTQSLEAFTVAQLKGIPSKLVTFPDENHWILHPQEAIVWQHEFFEFLNKYCK